MSIRPFDWRDLPTLLRYRDQSVFLNSALFLTRGPSLLTRALALLPGAGGGDHHLPSASRTTTSTRR